MAEMVPLEMAEIGGCDNMSLGNQVYMNLQQEVSPSPQVPFGSLHVCFHQLIPATADKLLEMSTELKILVVAHEGMDLRFVHGAEEPKSIRGA